MDVQFLYTLSVPSFAHHALMVAGASAALLAGLVFFNLAVLLPGLLRTPGGHGGDPDGEHIEFGPVAAPIISEPAPRPAASWETNLDSETLVRPHLWRHLLGFTTTPLPPPVHTVNH